MTLRFKDLALLIGGISALVMLRNDIVELRERRTAARTQPPALTYAPSHLDDASNIKTPPVIGGYTGIVSRVNEHQYDVTFPFFAAESREFLDFMKDIPEGIRDIYLEMSDLPIHVTGDIPFSFSQDDGSVYSFIADKYGLVRDLGTLSYTNSVGYSQDL